MKRLFISILTFLFFFILYNPISSHAATKQINTVSGSAITEGSINGISINLTSVEIYKGNVINLKINGTNNSVKWKTDNKNIAVVSKKGKVTGTGTGTTNISATLVNGSDKITLYCKVTVKTRITANEINVVCTEDEYKDISIYCDNLKKNEYLFYSVVNTDVADVEIISENLIRIIPASKGETSIDLFIGKSVNNLNYKDTIRINVFVVNDKEWIPMDYVKDIIGADFYLYAEHDNETYTVDYKGSEISFFYDEYNNEFLYNVSDLKDAGLL